MFSISDEFINKKVDIGGALIIDDEVYNMRLFIENDEKLEIFDNSIKFKCKYENTDIILDVYLSNTLMFIIQKCDDVQSIVYKVKFIEDTELYEGVWEYCYTNDECESFKNCDIESLENISKKCIFTIYNDLLIKLSDILREEL